MMYTFDPNVQSEILKGWVTTDYVTHSILLVKKGSHMICRLYNFFATCYQRAQKVLILYYKMSWSIRAQHHIIRSTKT